MIKIVRRFKRMGRCQCIKMKHLQNILMVQLYIGMQVLMMYFPEALQYAHNKAPNKYLIQSEACVDSEIPKWKDDAWYWSKEATDWGWDWAPEEEKYLHPKYAPVNRYARDIIGCLK